MLNSFFSEIATKKKKCKATKKSLFECLKNDLFVLLPTCSRDLYPSATCKEVQHRRAEEVYREIAGVPVDQYVPAHIRFGPDVSFFALTGIRAERLRFVAGRHVRFKGTGGDLCNSSNNMRKNGANGVSRTLVRGRVRESIRRLSRGRWGKKPKRGPGETKDDLQLGRACPSPASVAPEQKTAAAAGLVKRVINVRESRLPNSRPETPPRTAFGRTKGVRWPADATVTHARHSPPKNGGRGRNFEFFTPIRIGVLVRNATDVSPSSPLATTRRIARLKHFSKIIKIHFSMPSFGPTRSEFRVGCASAIPDVRPAEGGGLT